MSDMNGDIKIDQNQDLVADSNENNLNENTNTNGEQESQMNGNNEATNGNHDLNESTNGTTNGTNGCNNNDNLELENHSNGTNGNDSQTTVTATEEIKQNGTNNKSNTKEKLEPEVFRKVFVGSLNYSTTDESLRNHFCQFGELVDSVIMKESKTAKSRGFGFVTYKNSTMVDEMMRNRPHKLDGRELEVKRATPREESSKPGAEMTTKKLFVGGLRENINEDMLREYFIKYGKIDDCVVMKEKDSNKSRGFGFVTFEDYDSVDKIVLEKFHIINSQNVAVKKALPKEQTMSGGGGGGNQGRNMNNNHSNRGSNNNYNGRSNRNNNNHNGYNNYHNNNNGYNNNRYNDYNDEFNSNNFNDDGAYNNFSNNSNSISNGSNNYPPINGMSNNGAGANNSNMPGMSFTNLALMAQKMLQAANMGQIPGNFGPTNGNNFPPAMPNGNGFNNVPSGPGLLGPGDRNHSMNNGFNRNGANGGGPIRSSGNGNRRAGPYNVFNHYKR